MNNHDNYVGGPTNQDPGTPIRPVPEPPAQPDIGKPRKPSPEKPTQPDIGKPDRPEPERPVKIPTRTAEANLIQKSPL